MVSNRSFFVILQDIFSDTELINFDFPQWSTVGLSLFLTYITDLLQTLNNTGSYLYAGGTCIFY